jgi:hypothetical protein
VLDVTAKSDDKTVAFTTFEALFLVWDLASSLTTV